MNPTRRQLLRWLGGSVATAPFLSTFWARRAAAATGNARRLLVLYFPDGVPGPSSNGEPSLWHAAGSGTSFTLQPIHDPVVPWRDHITLFNGLTMGGTDEGSHPGGAKKLLTGVDYGNGESIDQYLARTVGADMPFHHLYLGVQAGQNGASGDKFVSYVAPGSTVAPEDSPRRAFDRLFGSGLPDGTTVDPGAARRLALQTSVIDGVLADLNELRGRVSGVERSRIDLHVASVREIESRILASPPDTDTCSAPTSNIDAVPDAQLYDPSRFPELLTTQVDLAVTAMACNLTRVAVVQMSNHTSELIMSRFPGTDMYDPAYDMRSHQASHYGASHDDAHREFHEYVLQRKWFVSQFAHVLDSLRARPEGDGTMLDYTIVLLCTEVCDGNVHNHSNMPFLVGGSGGGMLRPGRLITADGVSHGNLLASVGRAMGASLDRYGQYSNGLLSEWLNL